MTKKIFLLQFFSILLIFVLPPIFANPGENLVADFSKFNVFSLPCASLALFLFLQDKSEKQAEGAYGRNQGEKPFKAKGSPLFKSLMNAGVFLWTTGFLLVLAALFKALFVALKIQGQENVVLPKDAAGYAACALSLLSGAFYEECLYRLYLPKALLAIAKFASSKSADAECANDESEACGAKKIRTALSVFSEAAPVVLFALAHFWQGPWAAANALFAGIIFRTSFVKAKSVFPPFLAHLLYNAASLALA